MEHLKDEFLQLEELEQHHKDVGTRRITHQPEWISDENFARICLHTGITSAEETIVAVLKPLMEKLVNTGSNAEEDIRTRGSIVLEILALAKHDIKVIKSHGRYAWLIKFMCAVLLLRNIPVEIAEEINKFVKLVAAVDTEIYQYDPLLIHTLTKALFEDIPLEGMNLIHIIKKLVLTNQKLFYYIAVSLTFAGLHKYVISKDQDPSPPQMYRMDSFQSILKALEDLKIDELQQRFDIEKFYVMLKLLSCYQNVVILRHSHSNWKDIELDHACYSEFFHITLDQKRTFLKWLNVARSLINSLNRKLRQQKISDKEDFLLVIELIDLDMIPLMEDELQEDNCFDC